MALESTPTVFDRMTSHAESLNQSGLGDVSRMTRESLLRTMMTDIRLPEVHAAEGAKFSAMAFRIAPPELAAQFLTEACKRYPTISPMGVRDVSKIFEKFAALTLPSQEGLSDDERGHGKDFRYAPSESEGYTLYCSRHPQLVLAAAYFTVALQAFVQALTQSMRPDMQTDAANFGSQFNSLNITTSFAFAVWRSLVAQKGSDGQISDIDDAMIAEAMVFMKTTKQFELRSGGTNPATGERLEMVLQCPMEGYLTDLLLRRKAFMPVLKATERLDVDSKSNVDPKRMPHEQLLMMQAFHANNSDVMKQVAASFLP